VTSRFNFRIGTKLALVSGLGLVFVSLLVFTNRFANQDISRLSEELAVSTRVVGDISESNIAIRNIRIAYRDAKLATTVAEVDRQLAGLEQQAVILNEKLAHALKLAKVPANRERLQRAVDQFSPYLSAYREAIATQRDLLNHRATQLELAQNWNTKLEELRGLVVKSADHHDTSLLLAVEKAESAAKEARVAVWRFQATAEAGLKTHVDASLAEAATQLKSIVQSATDRKVAAATTVLLDQIPVFQKTMDVMLDDRTKQDEIAAKRANPLAEAIVAELSATETAAEAHNDNIMTDVDRAIRQAETFGLMFGGLVVVVLIGSAVFGNLMIARPIHRIATVLMDLAHGDKTVVVPYADRGDEVGDAAKAADKFKANLIRMDQIAAEQKAAESQAEAEKRQALLTLADNFEAAIGGIIRTVSNAAGQLQHAAQGMSAAAEETSHQAVAVASASEQASSNVQTVATAAEELSTSVAEISRQVEESSRIAGEAVREANDTVTKVSRLSASAQKIGDVVGLISTIAAQTNLLALNATIEAARAGEAGRGFAVVASEVKSLADQTAKATAEISTQIAEIQGSTAESASAIGAITETIRRMSAIGSTVAAAVEEQGAATREIARNVQQASEGTREVSSNISGVTRAASDSSTASAEVLSSAGALAEQAERLAAEVQDFLMTVRGGTRAA
jgi:methyl-accepting chemotaxis protein